MNNEINLGLNILQYVGLRVLADGISISFYLLYVDNYYHRTQHSPDVLYARTKLLTRLQEIDSYRTLQRY